MIHGFFKHPGLKLLAVVIAVSLWVLVAGEEEAVRVFIVPIDFALSKDRVLASETPGTVQVRLRGSDAVLRRVAADDLSLPLDLSSFPPGHRGVQALSAGDVRGVPSGAAVEAILPDRLNIVIDRRASRTVVVSPRFEGMPPPGYRLAETRLEPESIVIEGPETEVSRVFIVGTEPIPLPMRRSSFTAAAQVAIENPRISVSGPRVVQVSVHIVEESARK